MKALGVYAGIGAMLIAAKQKGWNILGNLEDRKIHTFTDDAGQNTFTEYFGTEIMPIDVNFAIRGGVDLIAAQPKCGGFSSLYGTGRKSTDKTSAIQKYGDGIRLTIDIIRSVQPKVFYLENLAKSLNVVTASDWIRLLPDYNIQFEWVSNYHYGNPQKGRNRMYVIGCHKDLDFIFIPQETKIGDTVEQRIGDLVGKEGGYINHDLHSRSDTDNITNLAKSTRWEDIAEFVKTLKEGENLPYKAQDGTIKRRIGSNKLHWKKHSHTLAGIKGAKFHPLTGMPISIRERCRLQGYPDDFIIHGTKYMDDGTWSLRKNSYPVRQLNNTVPYEFTKEFIRQLDYYFRNDDLIVDKAIRQLKPQPLIEIARRTTK